MHRLPLTDQLPYRFFPPKLSRFWLWATRPYRRHLLRREGRVEAVEIEGASHLTSLFDRGDGILVCPNHSDHIDANVLFEVAERVGRPFCYMAAYQIFSGTAGLRRWLFPRIGAFPVDREGADLTAFKAAVDILVQATHPLAIFPEGEVYFVADRLTPLREGAASVAIAAARKLTDKDKTVWVVPTAIKYRFLESYDPIPDLLALMSELETCIGWRPRTDQPLIDRIDLFATAMIGLKELEYLGEVQTGSLPERLTNLREHLLAQIEQRRFGERRSGPVPGRVKDLRRACLDRLAYSATPPDEVPQLQRDLDDLFVVVQLYSYPGDYIRECPTVERVTETLRKLEEDALLRGGESHSRGPRRAVVRLGPPIDVAAILREAGKPRHAVAALTAELEHRIQALLDAIGPGHPFPSQTPPPAQGIEKPTRDDANRQHVGRPSPQAASPTGSHEITP